MRPRTRRHLSRLAIAALATVGLVAGALVLLVTTQPGARLAVRIIGSRLPVALSVERVTGRLVGPLQLEGFLLVVDRVTVSAVKVELAWRPKSLLLDRRGVIDNVSVTELHIVIDTTLSEGPASSVQEEADSDSGMVPLPFPIVFDRVSVDGAVVSVPGAALVEEAHAVLTGSTEDFEIEGGGRVSGPSIPQAVFDFEGEGSFEHLRLERFLARVLDGSVTVTGDLAWFPEVRWEVEIEADSIAYGELLKDSDSWPGLANGSATTVGGLDGYQLQATVSANGPRLPPSDIQLAGSGTFDGIALDRFEAQVLDGSVTVVGDVTWRPRFAWDVHLAVDSVAYGSLLDDPQAWPGRASAKATTTGDLDSYALEATVAGTGPRLPPSDIRLAGRGTRHGFAFDEASGELLGGMGRVVGSIAWAPDRRWDVAVVLDGIHPGPLLPDSTEWPGAITLHGTTNGHLAEGKPRARVRIDSLSGSLRDHPLAGFVEGRLDGRDILVSDSWIRWGAARLTGTGEWRDSVDGRFAIDVPDLSDLHPDWTGVLNAEGDMSGRRRSFRVDADLLATDIQVDGFRVAHAGGHVAARMDSLPSGRVDLTIGHLSAGAFVADTVHLHADGTAEAHELQGTVRAAEGSLSVDLSGAFRDRTWTGELRDLVLARPGVGTWSLARVANLAIADSMASVDSLCLTAEGSHLCATGNWHRREPWSARGSIQRLPLALFKPLLPDSVSLDGDFNGDFQAAAAEDGLLQARVDVTLDAGTVRYPVFGEQRSLDYQPVRFLGTMGPEGLAVETAVQLTLPGGDEFGTIAAALQLPEYRRVGDSLPTQALVGHLDAELGDVSLIRALDPEITRATGRATANLSFEGTLGEPIAVGEARYENGEIVVPDLGVTLSDIEIVARGDSDGSLAVDGRIRSGAGTVTIAGRSPVVPSVERPATLTIKGDRFQAVNIPEADVLVSPDLRLSVVRDSIDLTGSVTIPRAIIELTEVPANAVRVSDDVVFVDVDTATVRGPVTITSSVRVILGDTVTFRGLGFRADLEGSFRAVDRPNEPTAGTGTITISRGRYRAYGQDLRIDQGRVIFNGAIDNPGLDIQAYREARDRTIAGFNIRGTLQQPAVSIYSNPAMSQSEAMSYIMFGRPLDQGSASEQNRMADAATGLGGDMLAQTLGAKVGLEAGVEQGSDPNDAAVVAGTYLSPQLFVAYGVGLFERVNIFRVRYEFNRRWSVQAESSQESSADLFFTFERK